jgi:hypothetical protein
MDARVKPAHDEDGICYGPGSAAHHAVKNGALRCVRGTHHLQENFDNGVRQ